MKKILTSINKLWVLNLFLCLQLTYKVYGAGNQNNLLRVNYKSLISRADLDYKTPASRSEEGMPIGNGEMGTLVWTTPSALRFQINRVDVFAEDATTVSFPRADSDYGSDCAYLDINLVQAGDDVFTGKDFHQHLHLYDGLMDVNGKGVATQIVAWHKHDVIAIEVNDQRANPEAININLRMLRYTTEVITGQNYELVKNHEDVVQTAEQTATSRLEIRQGSIILIQKFKENKFYDASAVAVCVEGRKSKAKYLNETTVQLSVPPEKGKFTIYVSSAASFDSNKDIGALALNELNEGQAENFEQVKDQTAEWWHNFWSQGFVHFHSNGGQADFVEENYNYFLYLMGSSSLGKYPPRFGGMLWYTNGDMRRWGSQYWWANTNAYYSNLMPSNRLELMEPMFSMYSGMYNACAEAAHQQWGSKGIWIPEITFFDGPDTLPDDIAKELQDLDLVRKPYEERSEKFQWYAETKTRHNARWNFQTDGYWDHGHYMVPTKGAGIFGHCTHILGDASRIGALYWQKFEFTMDTTWLRDEAYPIIKGAAEFYRNFPNLKKGTDGIYHIYHVNNGESDWNSTDTRNEVYCMHLIFPIAIKASEVLGVDPELGLLWKNLADSLVQLPEETRRYNRSSRGGYGAFVYGGQGAIEPLGPQKELKSMFLNFDRTGGFIDTEGIGSAQIFRNRLRLREGPGATDAEHIGGLTSGVNSSLLKDAAESLDKNPIIQIFSAWPKDWDAEFTLLAHGAFVVTSSQKSGKIEFVQIVSKDGQECRLINPWDSAKVSLYRDGKKSENLSGPLLQFSTKKGENIVVVPVGTKPDDFKQTIL
jgi:hypothetical protein